MLSRDIVIRWSPWLAIAAVMTILASAAPARAQDAGTSETTDTTSPMAAAAAEQAMDGSSHDLSLDLAGDALGIKVRRLRIAGWITFSAGWVFFGLGFAVSGAGSMDDSPWLRRIAIFESVSFALLTTGGALLLRARLIVWRRSQRARTIAVSASPSGLRATWSF